ncbi:MAG TPA: glycosyltransferase family 2 protein [Candidatus Saccharimonadales bacterium]|nr:glycosyltransferase family 2 protein [Candidatus Saccharimonadales bacterium]
MTDIEIPVGKRTPKYRFFEMLPAIMSYGSLLLPVVLSLINPLYGAIFITAFVIWWFVKAIGMAYRTSQGYNRLERARHVNWRERLEDLENPQIAIGRYESNSDTGGWRRDVHYKNLLDIKSTPKNYLIPSKVLNAVIIPFVNESREVLEPTIKSVLASNYDCKNNLIIILADEARYPDGHKLGEAMVKEYADKCLHMEALSHPQGLPYELIGKGGNITFAGRHLKKYTEKHGIKPENVIVTTLDSDNRPHPEYLASVTYEYIVEPKREHRSFQPIALFMNNIWDAPAPMRVLATGNSFWAIVNSVRPHLLRNFSSHSQGLKSLIKTDFWSVRTIVEDGHQYWRSYFAYDGDYEVTPISIPIYQDAVLESTYLKTLKAQFTQLRRWAYGASDVAYVADKGFRKDRTVPLPGLISRFWRLLESHFSWASASILITFGAWIPLFFGSESGRSIIAHELPQIASQIQSVAIVGLFITMFLALKMLPKRPARYKRHRTLFMLAQWLLMPVTSIVYGSAAAFNSQTRLFLGKYLEKFDLTVKAVKK